MRLLRVPSLPGLRPCRLSGPRAGVRPRRASGPETRIGAVLLAAVLALPALPARAHQPLPAFADVKAAARPSVAVLLARDGTPLAERRLDPQVRRLEWVGLPALSPVLKEALLAAEDKRFFEHSGVDWQAFAGSLWHNLWNSRKRGASTLSMQLAGLLDPELALGRDGQPRRSLGQKWDQAFAAQALEARWTKDQILEAYLNLAPFRGDLQGVHAAARAFFGKTPGELNRPESLILAVLLRGPNARPEVVGHRACMLAERLGTPAACASAQRLAQNTLDRQQLQPRWDLAPHAAAQLLHQPGERIVSTLDADAQKLVLAALRRSGVSEAAAVVLDNASGDVIAYVGALEPAAADALPVPRTSASLLAPLIYGLALERRVLTAATLLEDALSNHAPTLPDEKLWVSARRALADGLPEPAAAVQRLVAEALPERLRVMELDPARGPAPDLSLLQLAGFYRSLANGGLWQEVRLTQGERAAPRRLLRSEANFIVGDMLVLDDAEGVPQPFVQRMASGDGRDMEVAGFAERYTLVLWAAGGRWTASSAGAAWQEILRGLYRGTVPARTVAAPVGVVSSVVVFDPPVEPARREWFIRGTETDKVGMPRPAAHILHPAAGSLVDGMALADDPAFRIRFEASPALPGLSWRLDGERIGRGAHLAWTPVAGLHTLELLAADDRVLDTVTFAVRAPLP
ncbi:MAG TPA: transglycosylase domain-containing protein [Rhodocyclaceae bacterium]|nr:transglycosylase domain-containing protein [Rhodocyclaceae bacterium]